MELQCSSFCAGASYNLAALARCFSDQPSLHRFYANDVLWLDSALFNLSGGAHVFVYEYGCLVFWGIDDASEIEILNSLQPFLSDAHSDRIVDRCKYDLRTAEANSGNDECEDEAVDSYVDVENDRFIVTSDDICVYLSFSYALSQSIKIASFEKSVQRTIENNKAIPASLIKTGKIALSRSALSKKIGSLFYEKNSVNLNRYILNTPEFFWRKPKYESYYDDANKFMDISHRTQILNNKIDVTNELYTILAGELHHAHSTRLEIVVIILIGIEVAFTILRDILHWL